MQCTPLSQSRGARRGAALYALLGLLTACGGPGVPEKTILELDLASGLIEYVPQNTLARATLGGVPTVRATALALERAAEDERVVALIARVGSGLGFPAKVQELREAIATFRASGKLAVAWVESFGTGYAGTTNYYLASAFDEIWVLPIGTVGLAGLALEAQFIRGALDHLEVVPQMDSRWEYKGAKDTYTDTGFTQPLRESYARIVESQFERIAADIARARELEVPEVQRLADRGHLSSREALEVGLIDAVGYRDEVYASLRERVGEDAELLYSGAYLGRSEGPPDDSPTIAVIFGVGAIVQGESGYSPFSGLSMGSDSVGAAFRKAVEDEDVRAILFRIDSGGGSAVASQLVWRETQRAREAGKPVIATLSDVAGSGGYFIAMGADKIVAQPGTITGSIGVVGGKLVTRGFWDKLGITYDDVKTSANALMYDDTHDFTPEQWKIFQAELDEIYEQFTAGVAEGRGMTRAAVEEVARGRIWTGSDALELGLVDALGGFPTAIRLAKEAAGIPEESEVRLELFPRPRSTFDLLMAQLRGERPQSSEDATLALLLRSLESLRPAARLATALGLAEPPGELVVPLLAPLD